MLFSISQLEVLIFEEFGAEVLQSPIQAKIEQGEMDSDWVFRDVLFFKDRVYLLPNSPLATSILSRIHDSTHEGVQKMMLLICKDLYLQAMKTTIRLHCCLFTLST